MALFSGKKNTEKKVATKAKKAASQEVVVAETAARPAGIRADFTSAIIGPRITEKATLVSEKGLAYVFNVEKSATKGTVAKAVADLYKVNPVKVRIARVPSKQVFSRGKWGVKKGGKKAYVYLKAGEKIEIV